MKTRFQANTGLRRLTATVTDADVDDVELFELPRDAMVVGTLLGVQDAPAENATLKVGYKGGTETELVNAAVVGARKYSAATISAAETDNSYNDSAAAFPTWISQGDSIVVAGFTGDVSNNGTKVVVSATPSKIIVDATLVDDAVAVPALSVRRFPDDLARVHVARGDDAVGR